MSGPIITMPPSRSPTHDLLRDDKGNVIGLNLKQDWAAFLASVAAVNFAGTRYGSTANRPTSTVPLRFYGLPYYNTSTARMDFLASTGPDVWLSQANWPVNLAVDVTAKKQTGSNTAPGASTAKFEVVAGTNPGTAKLIMYAGTATTAVTVVDNVGAGF